MKRVLMALIAGAVLSGMAAAYASSVRPAGKPSLRESTRL